MDRQATQALPMEPSVQADMDRRSENVKGRQKQLVPVDTGKLSRSIEVRKNGAGRQIGSFDVDYALPVEEGYETKTGRFVQPQPYIAPSTDAARE